MNASPLINRVVKHVKCYMKMKNEDWELFKDIHKVVLKELCLLSLIANALVIIFRVIMFLSYEREHYTAGDKLELILLPLGFWLICLIVWWMDKWREKCTLIFYRWFEIVFFTFGIIIAYELFLGN